MPTKDTPTALVLCQVRAGLRHHPPDAPCPFAALDTYFGLVGIGRAQREPALLARDAVVRRTPKHLPNSPRDVGRHQPGRRRSCAPGPSGTAAPGGRAPP
ncbi:MAG: hypothetical protein ACRDI2_02295 [Chloroflexota bacterium]